MVSSGNFQLLLMTLGFVRSTMELLTCGRGMTLMLVSDGSGRLQWLLCI